METLYQLLALIAVGFILWLMYRTIQKHPELFERQKMTKSITTAGYIAVSLIAFVSLLVFLLNNQ